VLLTCIVTSNVFIVSLKLLIVLFDFNSYSYLDIIYCCVVLIAPLNGFFCNIICVNWLSNIWGIGNIVSFTVYTGNIV